jgi:FkbM family methyltransferase
MCRDALLEDLQAHSPDLAEILTVLPFALADYEGPSEFVVARKALAYSGLRERTYPCPPRLQRIPIQVRRIDDLFADLPALHYIKIDAEGGEYHILQGARRSLQKFRPVVGFEFGALALGAYQVTPADMARFWGEQGYKIYGIDGRPLTESEFIVSAQTQQIWDYVAVPADNGRLHRLIQETLTGNRIDAQWVRTQLHRVGAWADVGVTVPPMARFPRPLRGPARLVARLVLLLARVVTNGQRRFNHLVLRALRGLTGGLGKMEKKLAHCQTQLDECRQEIQSLQAQLAEQAQRLEQLQQTWRSVPSSAAAGPDPCQEVKRRAG